MKKLQCGVGKSKITNQDIQISDYPFEPSLAYPNKIFNANEISAISIDFGMCRIYVADDIILVSEEKREALKMFAQTHKIALIQNSWNWNWILEPYLDTAFTSEKEQQVLERLLESGFKKQEIDQIRAEVGKQMYKYNAVLWEWHNLGLYDVLSAMRAKYNRHDFSDFYKRAIAIDKRNFL